jgi:hypothetical protein
MDEERAMNVHAGDVQGMKGFIREEIEFPGEIKTGKVGKAARRVQEWLTLHGDNVAIDGEFGSGTAAAVRAFQESKRLPVTGVVDERTHATLVAPMLRALRPEVDASLPFGALVAAIGAAHLAEHPREAGGDNMGPWVRLYMDGHQGSEWFWCAGFVTFLMKQAAALKATKPPLEGSFSCDSLAAQGREHGAFRKEGTLSPAQITPGAIFLDRRTASDWTHTGIVVRAESDVFHTIEGNTNDDGSRNGYEVCARRRGYGKKDFVLL